MKKEFDSKKISEIYDLATKIFGIEISKLPELSDKEIRLLKSMGIKSLSDIGELAIHESGSNKKKRKR